MSNTVDAVDFVDMIEKHGFTRAEAKMFIDFNNARIATKDDLSILNANMNTRFVELESNVNTRFVELENKIDNTKKDIQLEVSNSQKTLIMWMFGMFITFFGLNSGFVYFLLRILNSN